MKRVGFHVGAPTDKTDAFAFEEQALLLSAESDRMLDGALKELGEERRAALLLRIDHGLGYGEISAAMGWTLQKVKNEIHRARLQLRKSLCVYLGEEAR